MDIKMKSLIIDTIPKFGGRNIPIPIIVDSVTSEYNNFELDDIQELIFDICLNNEGLHYSITNDKNIPIVSLNFTEPVKLAPNQNP